MTHQLSTKPDCFLSSRRVVLSTWKIRFLLTNFSISWINFIKLIIWTLSLRYLNLAPCKFNQPLGDQKALFRLWQPFSIASCRQKEHKFTQGNFQHWSRITDSPNLKKSKEMLSIIGHLVCQLNKSMIYH